MKTVTDFLAFPIRSDGIMYLFDVNGDMVADSHHDDGEDELAACAAALNAAHGHGSIDAAEIAFATSSIMLPVIRGGDLDLDLVDATGKTILRIRGWGRLQYLGEKEGIEAQNIIADAFVTALNGLAKE